MGQDDRVSSDGAAVARQEDPGVGGEGPDRGAPDDGSGREYILGWAEYHRIRGEAPRLQPFQYRVASEVMSGGRLQYGIPGKVAQGRAFYDRVRRQRAASCTFDDRVSVELSRLLGQEYGVSGEATDTDATDPRSGRDGG